MVYMVDMVNTVYMLVNKKKLKNEKIYIIFYFREWNKKNTYTGFQNVKNLL